MHACAVSSQEISGGVLVCIKSRCMWFALAYDLNCKHKTRIHNSGYKQTTTPRLLDKENKQNSSCLVTL